MIARSVRPRRRGRGASARQPSREDTASYAPRKCPPAPSLAWHRRCASLCEIRRSTDSPPFTPDRIECRPVRFCSHGYAKRPGLRSLWPQGEEGNQASGVPTDANRIGQRPTCGASAGFEGGEHEMPASTGTQITRSAVPATGNTQYGRATTTKTWTDRSGAVHSNRFS